MASDDFQGKNAPHEDNISDLNLENSSQGASGKPSFTNQLQYISKMVIKQTMSHKFAGPFLKPVNGKIYTVGFFKCILFFGYIFFLQNIIN